MFGRQFLVALAVVLALSLPIGAYAQDFATFSDGASPAVRINWDSFVAQGVPNSWYQAFADCVVNAYTRWRQVTGIPVYPYFGGTTTRTTPSNNEILITMTKSHCRPGYQCFTGCVGPNCCCPRLASSFGYSPGGNKGRIVVHRREVLGGTPFPFQPYWVIGPDLDLQAVLMHEFGHILGMEEHSFVERDTMAGSYGWQRWRFGPSYNDDSRLRSVYGDQAATVRVDASTDHGATWTQVQTNLASLGLTTSNDLAALRDNSTFGVFYTSNSKRPCYILGTVASYNSSNWWCLNDDSRFGVAVNGENGVYLFAYVAQDHEDRYVTVKYTDNYGQTWTDRTPFDLPQSYATPGVSYLGGSSWVLTYASLDWANESNVGRIVARLSTNNGLLWSPESDLSSYFPTANYRAAAGVSVAASSAGLVVGFSWARPTTATDARYQIRTFRATATQSSVVPTAVLIEPQHTRTQPAFGASNTLYHRARRGAGTSTAISTSTMGFSDTQWSVPEVGLHTTPATPALAADRDLPWVYLYSTVQ